MEIVIKTRTNAQLEASARQLLATGVDTGDSDVLNYAINLAKQEGLDVTFRREDRSDVWDVDLVWRLVWARGLDLRSADG